MEAIQIAGDDGRVAPDAVSDARLVVNARGIVIKDDDGGRVPRIATIGELALTELVWPDAVRFMVPIPPTGKARPRVGRRRAYTPAATKRAEREVMTAWRDVGGPRLPDGAVALAVRAFARRPLNHFRLNGELSAAGRRCPVPVSRPDFDNVAKLIADALNGLAYGDDAVIARASFERRWAPVGLAPCMEVWLAPWRPGGEP